MCIALHPVLGRPAAPHPRRSARRWNTSCRIPGVWLTTGGEIADWFNAQHLPRSRRTSRRGRPPMAEFVPSNTPPGRRSTRRPAWTTRTTRSARCPRRRASPGRTARASRLTVTLVLDYWELDPPQDASPRPAHRLAPGQILPRLADLEPARIRRARRHLPRAGRAGPVRRHAQRGARVRGGGALSGAGGRAAMPQRLLHGARQPTPRAASPAG